MISSAPRREATPAWARNLARRTPTMVAGGPAAQPLLSGDDALRAAAARDARGAHRAGRGLGRRARAATSRSSASSRTTSSRRSRGAATSRAAIAEFEPVRRICLRETPFDIVAVQPHPARGAEPRELHDRARAALRGRAARDGAGLEDGRRGEAALVGRARPRVGRRLVSRRVGGRARRAAQVRLRPLVHAAAPTSSRRAGVPMLASHGSAIFEFDAPPA